MMSHDVVGLRHNEFKFQNISSTVAEQPPAISRGLFLIFWEYDARIASYFSSVKSVDWNGWKSQKIIEKNFAFTWSRAVF